MSPDMDLAKLYNPYDFSNPVTNQSLFVGRQKELDELRYYLDQAVRAPRPINIAALGPRASGKTSLLNMIELEAKSRRFCVARVDLNESDAESPMSFFSKVFDAALNAACRFKKADSDALCFGGPGGKTYDVYLDMISMHRVPDEKEWCPFVFPIQYAKAMESGTRALHISEASFKADLSRIHDEVQQPLAILFDECNVLSNNRVLLEMLRNIFMNTAGFMLVFTGTPDLFPVMDDVFSPIVRQFKKIEIGRFDDIEETKQCIRKPLESVGIGDSSGIFEFDDPGQLEEIHELTGGRPYEIQLLCHFLFRRIQSGQARKMQLDVGVLDDVLRELGRGGELSTHPITAKVRSFDRGRLRALDTLTQCDGHATFEQLWFVEHVFREVPQTLRGILSSRLEQFVEAGILSVNDGVIAFSGDEFDRIYAKYYARQEKVPLLFPEFSYSPFFVLRMILACRSELKLNFLGELPGPALFPPTYAQDVGNAVMGLPDSQSLSAIFSSYTVDLAGGVYWSLFEHSKNAPERVSIVTLAVRTQWISVELPFLFRTEHDGGNVTAELSKKLDLMATRARALGGEFDWRMEGRTTMPEPEVLACAVEGSGNQRLKTLLSARHARSMTDDYLHKRGIKSALFHAAFSERYGADSRDSNNIGYIYLANREYQRAQESFTAAVRSDEPRTKALAEFNLGVAELMLGDPSAAREWFTKALTIWEGNPKDEDNILCLLVPANTENGPTLQEKLNPNPVDTVRQLLADASIF